VITGERIGRYGSSGRPQINAGGSTIGQRSARCRAGIRQDPPGASRQSHGHLLLGTAHRSAGNLESATQAFSDLAALPPQSPVARLELGRTLAAQGREAEALEALQRTVELEPNLAEAWCELSLLYASRGDTKACDLAYADFVRLTLPEQHLGEAAGALAIGRL